MLKSQKGITLVALVVTVIVLIILAAVTITLVVGQNGIITRAQEGAKNYINAQGDENLMIQNVENDINDIITNVMGTPTPEPT